MVSVKWFQRKESFKNRSKMQQTINNSVKNRRYPNSFIE